MTLRTLLERIKAECERRGRYLWVAAYAALLALFAVLYLPIAQRLDRAETSLRARAQEIQRIRSSGLDGLDPKRLVTMQQRAERFQKGFTAPAQAAQILDRISDLAKKHSVKLVEIHSESVVDVQEGKDKNFELDGKLLRKLPIQMKLAASTSSIGEFLYALETTTGRVLVVDRYHFTKNAAGQLVCDVTISFFLK